MHKRLLHGTDNLTMASMMGAITDIQMMMEDVTQKDFAKLNRQLNKIAK